MARRIGQPARQAARTTRTIRLVSLVVPLVLAALLLTLKPAHAATLTAGAGGAPPAASEPGEPVEGEGEEPPASPEEKCGEVEVEVEGEGTAEETGRGKGAACEGKPQEGNPTPPAECFLRSARARVLVYSSNDRVQLLIDYTTSAPTRVTVEYRLEGRRGSLKLGQARLRLARKGHIRLGEKLGKAEMAKVRAAKDFTVTMHIPAAPKRCDRYDSRRLPVKRTVRSEVVWSQSR